MSRTWLRVSSSSASFGFLLDFLRRRSQYLERSSSDLLDWAASRVTALLMNLLWDLLREATKLLLLKVVSASAWYFLWTSSVQDTYSLGSFKASVPSFSMATRTLVVNIVFEEIPQLNEAVRNAWDQPEQSSEIFVFIGVQQILELLSRGGFYQHFIASCQ